MTSNDDMIDNYVISHNEMLEELEGQHFHFRDTNSYLDESDFYSSSDDRVWQSNIEDIDGGDNFIDYCESIFELLEEEGYYEFFLLELSTGMRRGEILGLKWNDINLTDGSLRISRLLFPRPSLLRISLSARL